MAVRYKNPTTFISVLGATQVGCLAVTGILAGFSPIFSFGAVGGNAAWLMAMAKTVKRSRPDVCGRWFAWAIEQPEAGRVRVSRFTRLGVRGQRTYAAIRRIYLIAAYENVTFRG
ncbi:hypothetical protein F4801DRAFT_584505 [Xylaria longipes]|nr:hypothetical protein F4801DRAFT_584505 [Xylaria longipes]